MDALLIVRTLVSIPLLIFALLGRWWAYAGFVVLGLLYFPLSVGFALEPRPCEWTFDTSLGLFSLTNYAHIVMFACFFVLTARQFRMDPWQHYGYAFLITVAFGLLVEFGEGISGKGNCRMRDLIPDALGALIGAGVVFVVILVWSKYRARRADPD